MKAIKWIIWGVILVSLSGSSLSLAVPKKRLPQSEKVVFCETYPRQEIVNRFQTRDPLFNLIQVEQDDPESSRIGRCPVSRLAQVRDYVQSESFKSKVPGDLIIVAGAEDQAHEVPLYAIKQSGADRAFPSQQDISEVGVEFDEPTQSYALLITFSESGAGKWASLTRKNIGKDIAILYNNRVLSAPRVREEIKGGKCMISGKFTKSEIDDLKQILEN